MIRLFFAYRLILTCTCIYIGHSLKVIRARKQAAREACVGPVDDGIFDSILPDIVVGSARYSDLFLPLAEGMNSIAYGCGLSYAFEEDFPTALLDDGTGSSSASGSAFDWESII